MAVLALALAVLTISILCFVMVGILAKNQEHLERIAHEVYRLRNAGDQALQVIREEVDETRRRQSRTRST